MAKIKWNFSVKDIVYLVLIIGLCIGGWMVYKSLKQEVQQMSVSYKQLSATLARAENNMVTKQELSAWAKEIGADLGKIKKDLKDIGAELAAVGETVATIDAKVEANQGSDDTASHDPPDQPDECELCDIHSYTATVQAKDVDIGEMPHARVEFDASKDKPWTVKSDEVDVKVTTVVGEMDEDEPLIFYHTISTINKSRPELAGKEFKLKITSSEFKQTTDNNKEWYWWNPKLDLAMDGGIVFRDEAEFVAGSSLGMSIASYGRNKDISDWRFVRIGAGINYDKNLYVSFQPCQYNLAKVIPLVSDLWIGASVMWDGAWGATISIGTVL